MKRCIAALFVVITVSLFAKDVFAWLIPFSKERIAAAGKHCVHGYDGNHGQVGTYYAGEASAFNETINAAGKTEIEQALGQSFASKTVIVHPGPMVVPKYVAQRGDVATDWLITTSHGTHRGQSGRHMQIDVWLGGRIKELLSKVVDEVS